MYLEIISPTEVRYRGEVDLVQMPGEMGSFEILKNHAPLVALLEKGRIRIIDQMRNTIWVDISAGTVEVADNRILILTT